MRDFADILTVVVNGTVTSGARFAVTPYGAKEQVAWVWPEGSTINRDVPIPITSSAELRDPGLWLRAKYRVSRDKSGRHLQIETSVMGLCINATTLRCAVRIEYDRARGNEPDDTVPGQNRRPAAHVQIHGVSEELTYALTVAGQPLRRLDKFHIPVGGRRFRPSLEDFIEFLHMERLIPTLHPGWHGVISTNRDAYLRRQLLAAVNNDPEVVADELREMGYAVSPPAEIAEPPL